MNNLTNISVTNDSNLIDIKIDIPTLVLVDEDNISCGIEIESSNVLVEKENLILTEVSAAPIPPDYSKFIFGEIPNGVLNGVNAIFTSDYNFLTSSVEVFLNGVKQTLIEDYQLSGGNTITFLVSPEITSIITINYIRNI